MKKVSSVILLFVIIVFVVWIPSTAKAATFPTVLNRTTGTCVQQTGQLIRCPWPSSSMSYGDLVIVFLWGGGNSLYSFDGFNMFYFTTGSQFIAGFKYITKNENPDGFYGFAQSAGINYVYSMYRLASGTWTFPESSGVVTGTSTTPDPPLVTPSSGSSDYMWISAAAAGATVTVSAYPSGYSNGQSKAQPLQIIATAEKTNTASSENPGTFTFSGSSSWTAFTVSIKGASNSVAYQTVLAIVSESAGANCANAGIKVTSGLDNGDGGGTPNNGVLESGEVDNTYYICNGATGSTGPPGSNGFNTLMLVASEAQGANCANPGGGISVKVGLDNGDGGGIASDGILQAGEVDAGPFYVCNGATGSAGATGPTGPAGPTGPSGADGFNSLVKFTSESPGLNCANAGIKMDSGLDNGDGGGTARDGNLQTGEVDTTSYICNGAPGSNGSPGHQALVASSSEPSGVNCVSGGVKVQSGTDLNDDSILQGGEVTSTSYACNGVTGSTGPPGPPGSPGTQGADRGVWFLLILLIAAGAGLVIFVGARRRSPL